MLCGAHQGAARSGHLLNILANNGVFQNVVQIAFQRAACLSS